MSPTRGPRSPSCWRRRTCAEHPFPRPRRRRAADEQDRPDRAQERRRREPPVKCEPMSAPGIDAPAPTARSVQSTPVGRWPRSRRRRRRRRRRGSCRSRAGGSSPTQRMSAGTRSVPRISPIRPPIAPIAAPAITAARRSGPSPRWRQGTRRPAPAGAEVEAEDERRAADHDPQRSAGSRPAAYAPADGAGDGRRQHPGDEPPVDAPGPDVGDRRRGRGEPGDRDVGPRGSRRIRPDEQQHGQPDVPEDEPEEPSREGHEEAPDTDPRQHQPVHRLEYPP